MDGSIKSSLVLTLCLAVAVLVPMTYASEDSATLSNKASDLAILTSELPSEISILNLDLDPTKNVQLNLRRYSPFLENSVVITGSVDGQITKQKRTPSVYYYRGEVQGESDSVAFLAISKDKGEIKGSVSINESV